MRVLAEAVVRRLVHHLDAAPISLDPARSLDYGAQLILAAVLEPLFVQVGPGRFELGAAAAWQRSADGLTHRFELRHDGRWCDGRPVVADEFVTAFGRLFDPARATSAAAILSPLAEVEAVAPDVLRLVLRHPVDDLPTRLAAPAAAPVPVDAASGEWQPGPCNGPLCIEEIGETCIELRANPFARPGLRATVGLSIRIDRELREPLDAFERGDVDITCSTWFPFDELDRFAGRSELRTAASPIRFLVCANEDNLSAWADRGFRASLSACVDREGVAAALAGGVAPWPGFGLTSSPGAPPRLERMSPPPKSSLLVPDFYPNLTVAEAVTRAWRDAGLLDADVEAVDFPDFAARWGSADYDLCLALVAPPYPSEDALAPALAALAPGAVRTRALALAATAEAAIGDARRAAQAALEAYYASAAPFIPLLTGRSIWLQRRGVRGYAVFPAGGHSFRGLGA